MSKSDYVSVLQGVSGSKTSSENGAKDKSDSEDDEGVDEKEVEAMVEDLMCIKDKKMLKRNLTVMVRENMSMKKKVKKLERMLESQPQHLSFHVDTQPNDDSEGEEDILYNEGREVLTGVVEEEPVEEEKKSKPKNTCFNCLGDHMIAECPEPKDQRKIGKNRKEFLSQQKERIGSTARYHEDEPQKFGKLEPGLPSEKLREALGLKGNQLPEYIYKMRNLGYPPGWMMHAKISDSGMILYKAFGEKAGKNGEEEGEVDNEDSFTQYDTDKLKEWPGFNVYPSRDFRDESRYYQVPNISEEDLLKEMKKRLKPREQKGYKRRKMQDVSTSKDDHKEKPMELDSDSQEESVPPPPGEDPPEVIDLDDSKDVEDGEVEEGEVSDSEITGDVRADARNSPLRQDSATSESSVSKTEPGTPIVQLYSPFGSLPKMDSWAEGTTDHILFENLPDYTGKWEQMNGLIKNIRKRKSQLEKEDDRDY